MTGHQQKRFLCAANFLLVLLFCSQLESQSGYLASQSSNQPSSGTQTVSGAQEQQVQSSDSIPVLRTTTRLVAVDVVALDEHDHAGLSEQRLRARQHEAGRVRGRRRRERRDHRASRVRRVSGLP